MCNRLHCYSKPIKKFGYGWKLFRKRKKDKQYYPLLLSSWHYAFTKNWIKWDNKYIGDGFCFFLTRNKARKVLVAWKDPYSSSIIYCIRKIQYKKGLGKHIERNFTVSYHPTIALAKEFKIIKNSKG